MSDDLATWPAVRLAEAIRSKQLTSRELLELYLDRIERLNPQVNAVVTLDADRARASAAAADDAIARGDDVGPLHGLPITIKDAIATEGIRSTGGARELADHVPTADAPAVTRLKDAGAIVFGKTNLPRWSGDVQSFNDLFGTTNNPWAFDRIPGGSSGGAAAAVAAGFTSFELGTDIGGSVRIPSHCCGVFGLKPSFGVIPGLGYLDHVGGGSTEPDINVFGPIARSADDLELLLSVLAAPVPERAVGWRLELPEPTARSLGDLRIGTWFDDPACYIDNEYRAMLGVVVDQLADAGAHVEDRHPDVEFEAQSNVFMRLIMGAISPSVADADADARSGSHRAWLRAEEERAALRTVWSRWFQQYDVLLCPVMTVPAFEHDQVGEIMDRFVVVNGEKSPMVSVIQWLGLIGVLGLPSAVIPIGRTTSFNLPVGMQIVAPFLHDRRAVRVAQLASEVVGGYEVPPGFE